MAGDHEIGLARQADVADLALVVEVEQVAEHPLVGEGAHRQRRDELLGGCGQNDPHPVPALAETADEVEALVSGNAAADDQENATGHDGAWLSKACAREHSTACRRLALTGAAACAGSGVGQHCLICACLAR